jgi:D-alanine-D-alanine ligase
MTLMVLHLTGSASSSEFEDLSRLYAGGCLEAVADPARWEPVIAHVSPDGSWRFPESLSDAALADAEPMDLGAAVAQVAELNVDVMVPHMFCIPGMTRYRALFELLGIPFVGNSPEVMALGARKDLTRAVVAAAGVRVPVGAVIAGGERLMSGPATRLAPPVVIKPLDADNSAGITLVRDADGYAAAVANAARHGSGVLIEQYIAPGREVRAGILERDGELICLPLEEYPVDDVGHPIRSADDKLRRSDQDQLELVAKGAERAWIVDPQDPVTAPVWAAARRCHVALGCRHYSLFDFRIDAENQPWFLEAGLYCSFAPSSVVATMAAAAGLAVPELFTAMIAEAVAHHIPAQRSH